MRIDNTAKQITFQYYFGEAEEFDSFITFSNYEDKIIFNVYEYGKKINLLLTNKKRTTTVEIDRKFFNTPVKINNINVGKIRKRSICEQFENWIFELTINNHSYYLVATSGLDINFSFGINTFRKGFKRYFQYTILDGSTNVGIIQGPNLYFCSGKKDIIIEVYKQSTILPIMILLLYRLSFKNSCTTDTD